MKLMVSVLWLIAAVSAAIVGIDYGHQFTKAVLLAPGISFEALLTDEAKRKDLSGVCIRQAGQDLERIYGSAAQGLFTRFPQSCVANIKPLLGKSVDSPATQHYLSTHFGVKVLGHEQRANALKFDFGLKNQSYVFSTEELLAMSFKELKARALDTLEENPTAHPIAEDVVVSVPPFADQLARQAYIDALELAGFSNVLGLVDEGTAVALNFVANKKFETSEYSSEKTFYIVYDMGAGSTAATLFSVRNSPKSSVVLEIETVAYDQTFGGQDLTSSIYSILVEKLATSLGTDETAGLPARASARLFEAAEKAKTILSANTEYHVSLESIVGDNDFKTTITRDEFEQINIDSMQRITRPILDLLADAKIKVKDINSVILAGGSTRVPFVQKHLSLLVGDDKISKTVNADESCAMGTTNRGFQLKSQFGTNKDLKFIEKSFHNYELSVNQSDTQNVIFARGSVVGNTTRVLIGDLSDEVSLDLLEDGHLVKSYEFKDLLQKSKFVTCNDDPKYSKQLYANLTLNHNRIFDLVRFEVECVKPKGKDGLFGKILGSKDEDSVEEEEPDDEESTGNSTESDSNSTTKERTSRKILRPTPLIIPKAIYPGFQPLSKTQKSRIFNKLEYLDHQDSIRIELDEIKNKLEGSCYELRNLIEDHEDELKDHIDVDAFRAQANDAIEWLEYDSDNSSIEDFKEKVKEILKLKDETNDVLKMADTDLSFEQVSKLSSEGGLILNKLDEKLEDLDKELGKLKQKYEKEGFNYEQEFQRIKSQLAARGEDKISQLEATRQAYKEKLETLGKLVEDEAEFAQLNKKDVFEKYENTTDSIVTILADLFIADGAQKDLAKSLEARYNKLIERRAQKELREKLKQEKAKAKKEEEEAAADEDIPSGEEPDVEKPENKVDQDAHDEVPETQEEAPVEDDLEHDEL